MTTTYTFAFRRIGKLFWTRIYFCKGHQHDTKSDVMTVFLKGGGLRTVRKWKECELFLGPDFGAFLEEQAKSEGAQTGGKINR